MSAARTRWKTAVRKARLADAFASVQKRLTSGTRELDAPSVARAEQRRELRAAFDSVDTDKGGTLSVDELGGLLAALGQTLTDAELRAKMREIDVDGSGTLDFEEFVVAMDRWQDDELQDMFTYFNTDDDGYISIEELRCAVEAVGQQLSEQAFVELVAAIDQDGSGQIDGAEFRAFMKPMMSFVQQHSFTVQQLSDIDVREVRVTVNTMGIVLAGHSDLAFVAFPLQDEAVRPAVALASCSADETTVRFEVSRRSSDENSVVLLKASSVPDACLLVEKAVEAQARKNLRRKVAHNKQILALRKAFEDVDTDGSNQLDVEELGELLAMLGQEFTHAELRDRVRQLDEDESGTIEFHEFVTLMTAWQQEELHDMFQYFDDDLSGSMDNAEIGSCLSALGQDLTPEEVASLAAQVDSDGSGAIDVDEFIVFMRPFLNIAQKYQFKLQRSSDHAETVFSVSTVGVQLAVGGKTTKLGYTRIKNVCVHPKAPMTLILEIADVNGQRSVHFDAISPGLCEDIVGIIHQQVAKQRLRRQVQLHKQKLKLRSAFVAIDISGDGLLDLDELRLLLQTLGQELSNAGLRDKVRKLTGRDGSESIDFEQFARFMSVWQEEELNDVFDFFDDDGSGTISVAELSECIQALGKGVDEEEASNIAAHVDSDGSGAIERNEFFVFMRPMMSISQKTDYVVHRIEAGAVQEHETVLSVGLLGVQLTDGDVQVSYSFFALVSITDDPGLILTVLRHGDETCIEFQSHESASIVANVHQQHARLKLIRDINVDKQQRAVKPIFDMFDADSSGEIAADELSILLETLGQNPTEDEIKSRIKRYDTDSSGAISFDEFVVWMSELQEKEIEDAFNMFDKDGSGSISVRELQQLVRTMGERMTDSEVAQLAKHVDSDGSGAIDLDELKILLRPMMSLTDHASFCVELEPNYGICGGTADLVVSGLGLQIRPILTTDSVTAQNSAACQCVQCQRVITTIGYAKVIDIPERDEGLIILAKSKIGELLEVKVVCDNQMRLDILSAVKTQQGKLSLRSAIARSKEPKDSTVGTALLILATEPESRTQAQLKMLHKFLADNDLFAEMELDTEMQQMQCCRHLRAARYSAGDVLFREGDVVWDVYHVIEGVVSVRKAGAEIRQQWKGATFGALTVTGKLAAGRSPTIVCIIDCILVQLSRADYLRICGALENEVIQILGKPPDARMEVELGVVLGYLYEAHLFKVLYYELLQRACCRVMRLDQVTAGTMIAKQHEKGDCFRVILSGCVELTRSVQGTTTTQLLSSGESIGYESVLGRTEAEQKHTSTATTTEDTIFGTLTHHEFVYVSETIGESIVQILDKLPSTRSSEEVEKIHSLFYQFPFLKRLRSKLLQRHCCRHFSCRRLVKGETLFKQGELGDAMYIVLSGSMSVQKWRGANNTRAAAGRRGEVERCQIGTAFGESSLLAETEFAQRRSMSVHAQEESTLAVLSRDIYRRIKRTSELQAYIDEFWDMIMNDRYGRERDLSTDLCEESTYKKLHLAIGKSIHPDWTSDEALEEVQSDWIRDIGRHNSGNDVLNHRQFSDALFELVDEWCGTISMKMYAAFLESIYNNVKHFWETDDKSGKDKYVLAEIDKIRCIEKSLRELRAEGEKIRKRDNEELDKVYRKNRASRDALQHLAQFRAASDQRIKHVSEGASTGISRTHMNVAEATRQLLCNKFGARFASDAEVAYFLELSALRVLGPPRWNESDEEMFRAQLRVNIGTLDSNMLADVLNDLQELIITGCPRDETLLRKHKSDAEQALQAELESRGWTIGYVNQDTREHAIRELMRMSAGAPYWLPDDQERFEKMMELYTATTSDGTATENSKLTLRGCFDESSGHSIRSFTDAREQIGVSNTHNAASSAPHDIVWGRSRQLPGGFVGRVGVTICGGDVAAAAAKATKLQHWDSMDLSHVVAKVDTGNYRRRSQKPAKRENKARRRLRRAKAKSIEPRAVELPPVKRSASVPAHFRAPHNDAKGSQSSDRSAKKLAKRQQRREQQIATRFALQHERSGDVPALPPSIAQDYVIRLPKLPPAAFIGFML